VGLFRSLCDIGSIFDWFTIGEAVIVAFESDGEATIYSLPKLDRINGFSFG
jgi:hypothetical protein